MDDAETHARWRETAINDGGIGPVKYPLIADTTKQMSEDYDVVHEESGFSARGTYLIDPDGGGSTAPFTVPNRDFSYRSLLGNAVLRWEWREGSTLFLVWQQRRINALSNLGPNGTDPWVGNFDAGRDFGDMFGTPADNIFAIKVNYWLNP